MKILPAGFFNKSIILFALMIKKNSRTRIISVLLSSLSIFGINFYRLNDLNAVTSPEILTWVDKNSIELITYHDLPL